MSLILKWLGKSSLGTAHNLLAIYLRIERAVELDIIKSTVLGALRTSASSLDFLSQRFTSFQTT